MHKAILLLGGNMGDRVMLLNEAQNAILKLGSLISESAIYESEAWGFDSESNFINKVIVVSTNLKPYDLLKELQKIELKMGRIKNGNGYESRSIDIDILFYDNEIIDKTDLQIPHIHIDNRLFTLKCLLDIDPEYIHYTKGQSISELNKNCTDKTKVWEYKYA